jgi:hypothetical protein
VHSKCYMALQSRFLQGFSSLIFWGFGPSFLDPSCTALHGTEVLVEWDSALISR